MMSMIDRRSFLWLAAGSALVMPAYADEREAVLTAYTTKEIGKHPSHPAYGITRSGSRAKSGRTVAVDPRKIELGTPLYIELLDPKSDAFSRLGKELQKYISLKGFNGRFVAEDTGSLIRGNKIDVFFGYGDADYEMALEFGKQKSRINVGRNPEFRIF